VTHDATVDIAGRAVGAGQPCFVIAEAGVNHNGDPDTALELIRVASDAGADAVKFQTFTAANLVTPETSKAEYQRASATDSESQLDMLRRLELPRACYPDLMQQCRESNILFMSTPFDEESADFLDSLGMAVFKIASGEITNLPFLEHVGRKSKPMIVSTGMSDLEEVRQAVAAIAGSRNAQLVLLHCVSNYPADPASANLYAMTTLAEAFHVPVGYSDHVDGIEVALAAAALGACVIEKHFTLDRALPGPDHRASAEPSELSALIKGIRKVESALGDGRKIPTPMEGATAEVARKSIIASVRIPQGTILTAAHITVKRPGTGLPPSEGPTLVGRPAKQDIPGGTLLTREMFE
jgi:N,N'-diacetyllegionaminate synthase